jgi:sulfate-transporting ATPase
MEEVLRFALIGVGLGAMYSLASQGLIVIYRGSGVLNFAQGAIGMMGAYFFFELRVTLNLPYLVAALGGIAFAVVVGALSQLLVMRHLNRASPLTRVVATLGLLLTIQSLAVLRYGGRATYVPQDLPLGSFNFTTSIILTFDRAIMLFIALVLTWALWWTYRKTRFGLSTNAVAENQLAASTIGLSSERIALGNWAIGSGLAGLAAILISPIVSLQVSVMTNLVLAAMAAALVASFRSFPVALFAGLALGVAQTVLGRYTGDYPGVALSVPFVVIVVVLMVRGQSLPLRNFLLQRLPVIGVGKIKPSYIISGVVIGAVFILWFSPLWLGALTITLATALIVLSIVLLTGYAGQLSLAQFAFAGFGAWVAGRMVAVWHVEFEVALVVGVLLTVPLGLLFALPAMRTRGITLAVVTLGLGTSLEFLVFNSSALTGGVSGTNIGKPTIFGFPISAIEFPERYAAVLLLVLIVFTLGVSNIRRGRSGRRLIAVRTNERAAAALGINVVAAKLYAFSLAAGIAAAGGIFLAFRSQEIAYGTQFVNFLSISSVGWAMIGGIGFLVGPIIGATLAPGSVGAQLLFSLPGDVSKFLPLISGLLLILFVLQNQDGSAKEMSLMGRLLLSKMPWGRKPGSIPKRVDKAREAVGSPSTAVKVPPKVLEIKDLTVRYGMTTAVDSVSFRIEPGKVLAVIGPNGAGKTSLIDAITGFTPVSSGTVIFDGQAITTESAVARSRRGISRSFQSLELFEDSTVLDNLQTAADPSDFLSYVRDLVWPANPGLPPAAEAAIREFGLGADLERNAQDLPYGRRRLLALARAVASQPSVLLLDEPAAGLGDVETTELGVLVKRLAREWGIAVLVVEHDMNFVMSVCDEIVVVDFGCKIAQGSPTQVRADPAVLSAYLGETTEEQIEDGQTEDGLKMRVTNGAESQP